MYGYLLCLKQETDNVQSNNFDILQHTCFLIAALTVKIRSKGYPDGSQTVLKLHKHFP
jgi:hypothetical protein